MWPPSALIGQGCQDSRAIKRGKGRENSLLHGPWWLLMGCSLVQLQPGVYTETAFKSSHSWRLMSVPHLHCSSLIIVLVTLLVSLIVSSYYSKM